MLSVSPSASLAPTASHVPSPLAGPALGVSQSVPLPGLASRVVPTHSLPIAPTLPVSASSSSPLSVPTASPAPRTVSPAVPLGMSPGSALDGALAAALVDKDLSGLDDLDYYKDTRSDYGAMMGLQSGAARAPLSGSLLSLPLAVEARRERPRGDSDPVPLALTPLHRQALMSASQNSVSSADSLLSSLGPDAPPPARPYSASRYTFLAPQTVEQAWDEHVSLVLEDAQPRAVVDTPAMFTALFRELSQQQYLLTREACQLIGDALGDVPQRLLATCECFTQEIELPHVYADSHALAGLAARLPAAVLELSELSSSHRTRRAAAHTALARLREAVSTHSQDSSLQLEIEVCAAVAKTHFQLAGLLQSFAKLLAALDAARASPLVRDLSAPVQEAVLLIREALAGPLGDKRIDTSSLSKARALQYIESHLARRHIRQACALLHAFRRTWPQDVFGGSELDDVDVLVCIFAQQVAGGPGCLALTAPDHAALHRTAEAVAVRAIDLLADLQRRRRGTS